MTPPELPAEKPAIEVPPFIGVPLARRLRGHGPAPKPTPKAPEPAHKGKRRVDKPTAGSA